MPTLVGKAAPEFKAKAAMNGQILTDFSLRQYHGRYVVFFFYPLDFTFVCPTELHAFQDYQEHFEQRDATLVACSVDSPFAHAAWLNTPKNKGGISGITYPLVSDINKTISRDFGVLNEKEGIAYRGLFLLDREGIIRHQTVNDLSLGRSVPEVLRTLDALIHTEKHGEVCPANWNPGQKSLIASQAGVEAYFV